MDLRLLGAVEIRTGGGELIPLRRRQERLALGVLLLEPGRPVAAGRLISLLWEDTPPPAARNTLQAILSRLRKALRDADDGEPRLLAQGDGYVLLVRPETVDLHRFRAMVEQARTVDDPESRSAGLAAALELWRGPALADAASGAVRARLCDSLEELRFAALSDRIDADLAAGRHAELVEELCGLVAEHPLREQLYGQLMLSLYRCGRRADALDAYRRARRLLVDELGIEPGPRLRTLEARIIADRAMETPTIVGTGREAAAAAALVPAQLPPDVAGFVGRAEDLRRLDALLGGRLTAPMICVITGAAGVGKTTLAVHWAQLVRDRFADGQLYLNLRGFDPVGPPTSPAEVLPVLLQMLLVPAAQIPATVAAQVGVYRSILAGRRMLIVLDNVRDAEQVRPLLPGVPGCAVVMTSRCQLTSLVVIEGANLLPLDLLSAAEARELLVHRLGAARVAAESATVDDLIARCARLPLALAIVAARAATHPGFALATLAGGSGGSHAGLDAFDGGDHATQVRSVFSWSYQTLSPDAARLFRLLGLHPGPDLAAPAAASLAGAPLRQVRPLLAELARAHLVTERLPGRYSFHDLLRAYAVELGNSHDCDTERRIATHRLLDHYLHTAHTAHCLLNPPRDPITVRPRESGVTQESLTDHVQALAWFTAEHAVLIAMIGQAAATVGFETHAWQLAWTLTEFFSRRGHWHDWVATHRTALEPACRQADRLGQAHLHRGLGVAHVRLSQHDDAHAHFTHALRLFTTLGEHASQGRTHLGIGWLLARQHHHSEALRHARQALDIYRTTDNQAGQAIALNAVGWYHAQLGDHEETLVHCGQALRLLRDSGDHRGEAGAWDSLGYAHLHLGDHRQAIICCRQGVEVYRKIGDRYNEADALTHLGEAHDATGDHETARDIWRQALVILTQLGHPDADRLHVKLIGTQPPLPDRAAPSAR
jgi:DNA-binding SARP family transcriptional activator